jgi:signal transduction histidine kinase/CheY-like chemotaxis protein
MTFLPSNPRVASRLNGSSCVLLLAVALGFIGGSNGAGFMPLEQEAPWRIVNFAPDAGVLRRMVFDIAFETNHTVWFAVSDGLYRYDGYRWQRFTVSNSLPSSFIRTVSITRDGTLWVGSDKGAGVFDGRSFDSRQTDASLAGPNVRRIVETKDGALWFCCDRWPDPTASGGLTRLQGGRFRTYGMADGLPSDHLLDLFEQSNGRLIAMTANGPAVWQGGRWQPIDDSGYPAKDHTWTMQEAADGSVFAQAFNTTLVMRNGTWQECLVDGPIKNLPFCVTQDGSVLKGIRGPEGGTSFARWNGKAFVTAAREIAEQGLSVLVLRQAPDGSIWGVGRGTILRWEYLRGFWDYYQDLPRPVLEDSQRRLWFANPNGTAVMEGEQIQRIPAMRSPLIATQNDEVWAGGSNSVMRWRNGQIEQIAETVCGISNLVGGITDAAGAVWLHGRNHEGASALAAFSAGNWSRYGPGVLGNRAVLSWGADMQNGIWIVLVDTLTSKFDIARASVEGFKLIEIDGARPQTHLPSLCVSRTHLFLYAYNGLWESPLGDKLKFTKVQSHVGGGFTQGASQGDIAAFLVQEGFDGNAGVLVRRGDEWLHHRIEYGEALTLSKDGTLMVANGAELILWRVSEWNSPNYLTLPTETTITSMLALANGQYWLGTLHGVLNLRPSRILPATKLAGQTSLRLGEPLKIKASGIAPFTPQSRTQHYLFSWRIDGEPWSGFDDMPADGIPTAGLACGTHHLQVRARDGIGNEDPNAASHVFEVLAIPVQDRRWFRPALAGVSLSLVALSVALYGATRRLRRHSDELEEQVQARTAELRKDIHERLQTETEKNNLRAQLAQAQKMESVGRLAGGVAHDFNNMLQAILGNVTMALENKSASAALSEHLVEIQKAAQRSADLTRQLLAFARKQTVNPKILDLNDTLSGMLKMLRRLIGEDIQLAWQPGPNLWPVKLDPSQLDQVLANLAVNARDAIRGVGKITIETSNAKLAESHAPEFLDMTPGEYVMLSVTDTGCGMDDGTRSHLFEPYFTTKEAGKGTGLGLATVYGIIKQNDGLISVASLPNQGTTFRIYLPRVHIQIRTETHPIEAPSRGGTETVMLVEDEPAILKLGQRMLISLGYHVLAAATPSSAIHQAKNHAGEIHLLMTDVIMPEMNGRTLANQLTTLYPKLKCLFVSGYTADIIAHHGVLDQGVHFIEKPFTKSALAAKIREVLETDSSAETTH